MSEVQRGAKGIAEANGILSGADDVIQLIARNVIVGKNITT
jgi:hypothetical protein